MSVVNHLTLTCINFFRADVGILVDKNLKQGKSNPNNTPHAFRKICAPRGVSFFVGTSS